MKITKAKLTNGEELVFGDFNVFVGGNGVGKTTIISELFYRASDIQRNKYWWIETPVFDSDNVADDMIKLRESLSERRDGFNTYYYSPASKNANGDIDLSDNVRFSKSDKDNLSNLSETSIYNQSKYRRPFVSFLSCESRLGLKNESNLTRRDAPPQDSVNVLSRSRSLRTEIDRVMFDIYKNHFILLDHVGPVLQVGISRNTAPDFDRGAISEQSEFNKIEEWKQAEFTPIEEAGHGLRSMARLLTGMVEPVNQVIIIDEPEIHIYPSQKRWLGQHLVNLASKERKQVFLVTHDPMILQGILDENTTTNIFRVHRDLEGKGLINACQLSKVSVANAVNQDQYLQALFYQRFVVVEGSADRAFYQYMFSTYKETSDRDLGVVIAGGADKSEHVVKMVADIGLEAAFIYDLDVLVDKNKKIKDFYQLLGGVGNPMEMLESAYEAVLSKNSGSKSSLRELIGGCSKKAGFSPKWRNENEQAINDAIHNLSSVGIFIVPSGALESWAPELEEGSRFPEHAPELIKKNGSLKKDFDDFARKVLCRIGIDIPGQLLLQAPTE